MKAYVQFYIEFERNVPPTHTDVARVLSRLAAVAANAVCPVSVIEYRAKGGAFEYRIVSDDGVEVKVGLSIDPKGWVHVSAPEIGVNVKDLAYRIINHDEFRKIIKQEGE